MLKFIRQAKVAANRLLGEVPPKPRKVHWSRLVNAESEDGTWDWFNPAGESRMKLVKFVDDKRVAEVEFSKEEWIDLVNLIRRIS